MEEEQQEQDKDVSGLLLNLMEGYRDSVIPPLSDFSPFPKTTTDEEKASGSRKRSRGKASKSPEGLRREKMADLFSVLQSMVPNLSPQATKAKTIDETIDHITRLENKLNWLKKLKDERSKAWKREISADNERNSIVDMTVSGNLGFFGIHLTVRRRLVMEIFAVFEKHGAEILAANVAVDDQNLTLTVTATVNGNGEANFRRIKEEISGL